MVKSQAISGSTIHIFSISHDTEIFQNMKNHSVHTLYGDDGSSR